MCNISQNTATYCNTLHNIAALCTSLYSSIVLLSNFVPPTNTEIHRFIPTERPHTRSFASSNGTHVL